MNVFLLVFLLFIFIVLIIVIITLVILFEDNIVHQIEVINNCPLVLQTLLNNENNQSLSISLNQGQSTIFEATPGFVGNLTAASNGTSTCNFENCPYTTVEISFANIFGNTLPYMKLGEKKIVKQEKNFSQNNIKDEYIVSLSNGYNIPISVNSNTGSTNGFSNILTDCPLPLQVFSGNQQIACASACLANLTDTDGTNGNFCCATENCYENWDPFSYYSLFADLCPECQITQYKKRIESAPLTSQGTPSKITITLCP